MSWLESFPQGLHGWGPLAPEAVDDSHHLIAIDRASLERRPHMKWLNSFPHEFHGWGPLAPDAPNGAPDLASRERRLS